MVNDFPLWQWLAYPIVFSFRLRSSASSLFWDTTIFPAYTALLLSHPFLPHPTVEPRPSSNSLSRYPRLYTQCFYNQFWWNKTYTNFPGHNARCKHSTDRIGLYCKNPLSSFPKASTVIYLLNTFFSLSPFSAFTYLHMTRQEINSVFHMFNTNGNILAFSPTQ